MSMGRYLCQLCYTIVHYEERRPCFFYKDDEEVYVVPPPSGTGEMERRGVIPNGSHGDNSFDNNGSVSSVSERNINVQHNEINSLLNANHGRISLMPPTWWKRSHSSLLPSDYQRGKKSRLSNSKSGFSTTKDGEGSSSENPREMRGASAYAFPMEGPSANNSAASSSDAAAAAAAAASVAGPSGVRVPTKETRKEKPFPCDVCDKAFAYRTDFERHYRTHTGDKPFTCNVCHKSFSRKGNMTTHLRTHTGERPFECEICGKRFVEKAALTKHVRTHTGEKPYRCEFCGRGFAQSSACKTHEKMKHGKK